MQKNRQPLLSTLSSGRCGSRARFLLNGEKGSSYRCTSYRPISLLSVPGKVFANVLLARLHPLLTTSRRPQQSGFTANRTAIDVILAARLLTGLHREENQPLTVAYIST